MKQLTVTAVLLSAVAPWCARADIVPTSTHVTNHGLTTWAYQLAFIGAPGGSDSARPAGGLVAYASLSLASSFTLYDFAGYVIGSCTAPAGWVCTHEGVGTGLDAAVVHDRADILNLTWYYTSGPNFSARPADQDLGLFTAQSVYGSSGSVNYLGRVQTHGVSQLRSVQRNVGDIQAPVAPTLLAAPTTLALAGLGLALLGMSSRRKAR